MLFKNLSQVSAVSTTGLSIQNSLVQGLGRSGVSLGESTIARRGCCGGRRGNNIDIDIDIDINIGGGRGNWC
ncbi:hypothetical protein DFA_07429 [Cavenderia fasciculata]|uniref:Uncharacterized protein n=1 Tax=Cavenderia fasciculata TaxID=261658 RepID=F4PWE2_CACFS|nr:uncharacterized protein DFA_07429 [Cavenderia fasciculata]EGG20306.1 hypothetical protein DFA_07429 [Cavenderia fasciculata]|eukprot:XP_004367289.1 hypothetical protein DFA_07429 [Cavenderia fasciculata]